MPKTTLEAIDLSTLIVWLICRHCKACVLTALGPRPLPSPTSCTVIRAPLQDRLSPIQLLQQQQPGQFVGKRHWRQAQLPARRCFEFIGQSVCSTDDECQPFWAKVLQPLSKVDGCQGFALFHQQNRLLIRTQGLANGICFLVARAVSQFGHAQSRKALEIKLNAFLHPAFAHFADGNDPASRDVHDPVIAVRFNRSERLNRRRLPAATGWRPRKGCLLRCRQARWVVVDVCSCLFLWIGPVAMASPFRLPASTDWMVKLGAGDVHPPGAVPRNASGSSGARARSRPGWRSSAHGTRPQDSAQSRPCVLGDCFWWMPWFLSPDWAGPWGVGDPVPWGVRGCGDRSSSAAEGVAGQTTGHWIGAFSGSAERFQRIPTKGHIGEISSGDRHIDEPGVEREGVLQNGISEVGAIQYSRIEGGVAEVGAGEIGILQFGAVQAGALQVAAREIGFTQIGEVEGDALHLAIGEISTNQHLFGVIHRGLNRSHRQAEHQHQCEQRGQQLSSHHQAKTFRQP